MPSKVSPEGVNSKDHAKDVENSAGLSMTSSTMSSSDGATLLSTAKYHNLVDATVESGDLQLFEALVTAGGRSLFERQPLINRMPMSLAIEYDRHDIFDWLIASCSDADLQRMCAHKDWLGKNAVLVAAYLGKTRELLVLANLCLEGRISVEVFNAGDTWGKSNLEWAVKNGHVDVAEVLVVWKFMEMVPQHDAPLVHEKRAKLRGMIVKMLQHASDGAVELEEEGGDASNKKAAATVKVDETLAWDVIEASCAANMNPLMVILDLQDLLEAANFFPDAVTKIEALALQVLELCQNKEETRAVLAPVAPHPEITAADSKPGKVHDDPRDPIRTALIKGKKALVAHPAIFSLLYEKFDPFGSLLYFNQPAMIIFTMCALAVLYSYALVVCSVVMVIRPFWPAVHRFSQAYRGGNPSIIHTWHIPVNRWLSIYINLVIFAVLLTYQAFSLEDAPGAVTPLKCVLAVWVVAFLVDHLQEYLEATVSPSKSTIPYNLNMWNMLEILGSFCYITYFGIQYFSKNEPSPEQRLRLLSLAQDFLAGCAICFWTRLLGLFSMNDSVGPLLQTLLVMLTSDVVKFAVIFSMILLGFTVGLYIMFFPFCVTAGAQTNCVKYGGSMWDNHGIGGFASAANVLQFVIWGTADTEGFKSKAVVGPLLLLLYSVISIIILLNLFIAMLADTYTLIKEKALIEYKYSVAHVIADLGDEEAQQPPMNLLRIGATVLGWLVTLPFRMRGGKVVQPHWTLVTKRDSTLPLFSWYKPQNAKEHDRMLRTRQRVSKRLLELIEKRRGTRFGDVWKRAAS